jgi:DNA polymerase elongation subunit (family B)
MSKQTHVINNTTNNNTQNNQFNLNVFLNEECKDAINIVDFVESLKITVNDLEQTGHLGYVQGITRIFVQALKQLDVTMRPVHCTDIKRETVYIKDQDNWEKENNEKTKLRNVLKKIARKNLKMLPAWQEQNPDFRYLDTRENNEFIQISLNSLGPETREEQERQEDKIIRNVLKEVVLDKTRKSIE